MEMAGIDMLPPSEGVPVVRRELTAAGPGSEVLVAGALGVMLEERHPTGGLDPERRDGGDQRPSRPDDRQASPASARATGSRC